MEAILSEPEVAKPVLALRAPTGRRASGPRDLWVGIC